MSIIYFFITILYEIIEIYLSFVHFGILDEEESLRAPALYTFEAAVPNRFAGISDFLKCNSVTFILSALFAYFRVHPSPECYGTEMQLPGDLKFPFHSHAGQEGLFIVRQCYKRILSIVNKRLNSKYERGIIFSGAQGNGKVRRRHWRDCVYASVILIDIFSAQTWCSLLIVWQLVYQQKTVVYELCEQGVVLVIPADGPIRILNAVAATCGSVPELNERETVHVFDGKASACHEPYASEAFLIVTTSRNCRNYVQTSRRPDIYFYCIPSYDEDELLRQCARFQVEPEEVRRRCSEIGPSIRYILTNNYETSKVGVMDVARRITAEQMDVYIDDVNMFGASGKTDIAACLLVVVVEEDLFEDPDDAYLAKNVLWQFASKFLCRLVMDKAKSDATTFIRNFITEVNLEDIQ